MRYILLLFLFAACAREGTSPSFSSAAYPKHLKPVVGIAQMEDCTKGYAFSKTTHSFTNAVIHRLRKKNELVLGLAKEKENQFLINMQLVDYKESIQNPSELSISINLKIFDLRLGAPRMILQEQISHTTLLEKPFQYNEVDNWQNRSFHVSPIGLSHAKLSREIAARIEEQIKLAMKG